MKEKKDNIYIYLWEEFNTIYIGRTVNPRGRHYAHKHRESEKTYQFSSEHHVEHPKMIIIENNLSIEDGVELEKYWINYYRENSSYNILNKTNGGEIGGQLSTLTEEEKKEKKKIYNSLHKEERNIYYKKYYKEHIDANKVKERKMIKAQKRVEKQILKSEAKIGRLIYKELRKKKYYDLHKEKMKKYFKEYRNTHREELLEKKRIYYKKHINEIREKAREYQRLKRSNSQK